MDISNGETGRRLRDTIRNPLVLLLVGVIGSVVVTWGMTGRPASPQVLVAFSQVFNACTLTGAVWLGAVLAYGDIARSRT